MKIPHHRFHASGDHGPLAYAQARDEVVIVLHGGKEIWGRIVSINDEQIVLEEVEDNCPEQNRTPPWIITNDVYMWRRSF